MMFAKIPIAATALSQKDLLSSLLPKKDAQEDFLKGLSALIGCRYLFLCSSGLASFYLILEALKNNSAKSEVVIPAYTAPALIVVIRKAGLKPILCDISLTDFNLDLDSLDKAVNHNTLAILGIHMFGIVADIGRIKQRFPDCFIIEDCAQALGSKFNGVAVGNSGDVSFFSFNKGKNLSTSSGGYIATNSQELFARISKKSDALTKDTGFLRKTRMVLKIFALSLAVEPLIYGMGYRFISQFKENAPPKDFCVGKYTDYQAKIGFKLLKQINVFSQKRYLNGMRLVNGLKAIEGIILPKIDARTQPAFNRLPVIIKDPEKRKIIEKKLWEAGIETSRLYLKPIHHIFDLGYKSEDFPNAVYLAGHLLTLAVHPLVGEESIEKMSDTIKKVLL